MHIPHEAAVRKQFFHIRTNCHWQNIYYTVKLIFIKVSFHFYVLCVFMKLDMLNMKITLSLSLNHDFLCIITSAHENKCLKHTS